MNLGNVFILGDSYSTFEGCINEGYATYYCKSISHGNVVAAEQTWWYKLIRETGSTLVMNNSYSGSTVCNTGYNGNYCVDTSFATRVTQYLNGIYQENKKPDTVLIFGGTNDFWAGSPLGEPKYSDWNDEDLKSFLPAFCYILTYIKQHNPECRIITIVNNELGEGITAGMCDISAEMKVGCVRLSGIEKDNFHPTANGMEQIKTQIIDFLKNTHDNNC